jgi:geranylgeranylglycerol-phosphate geranylgeranyltransferase
MRIYYSFVTGIAGWVGLSHYQFIATTVGPRGTSGLVRTIEVPASVGKQIVIILILFLAWGINQIVNDFLGYKEDRINAPQRPMVTGELKTAIMRWAVVFFMLVIFWFTWFYSGSGSIFPLVIGAGLNVLYEFAKGHGNLGEPGFWDDAPCVALYGFYAAGQWKYILPEAGSARWP